MHLLCIVDITAFSNPADYGGKKYAGQFARKREGDRPDPGRKPVGGRGGRAGQRYVRPREKMGGKVRPRRELIVRKAFAF